MFYPTPNHISPVKQTVGQAYNISVYSNINSTSSKIPKQFADILYREVKKICILDFISKYLLLYLTRGISVYLTFIKSFYTLN